MNNIKVTGFKSIPPFAQGLVRDLRVRWALEEAGLNYDVRLIGFDERNADWYRDIHPFGMVPFFEADGDGLFESGAIVLQIAESCEKLMPSRQKDRAETIQWMFAALNTIEPLLVELLALDTQHSQEEWAGLRRPALVDLVMARLNALSRHLEKRDYLLNRFTAADILMTTVLRFVRHTTLVADLPSLAAYQARCEARLAFQRSLSAQISEYAEHESATN